MAISLELVEWYHFSDMSFIAASLIRCFFSMLRCCFGTLVSADAIYPYFIANTAMGMNLKFQWFLYAGILGGVTLIYFVISSILTGKIKRIIPAEVLKNRE